MPFQINTHIKFKRNPDITEDDTLISYISNQKILDKIVMIIESPSFGWIPSEERIKKFGLSPNKKYLFVRESELIQI